MKFSDHPLFLLYILGIVLQFFLWVWALTDMRKTKFEKQGIIYIYIFLVVFFPIFGSIFYFQDKYNRRKRRGNRFNPNFKKKYNINNDQKS